MADATAPDSRPVLDVIADVLAAPCPHGEASLALAFEWCPDCSADRGGHYGRVAAAVLAACQGAIRAEALRDAAVRVERLRQVNPINGDGSNHTLDRVLSALDAVAGDARPSKAAQDERQRLANERDLEYLRVEAISARARGNAERERWALDQIIRLEDHCLCPLTLAEQFDPPRERPRGARRSS